jgi:hypothetical protein
MLQLREDQIEALDAQGARTHVSRSRLVREAIDASLRGPREQDVAELYRLAYPTPEFGHDEWGDLDEWHAAAARHRAGSDPEPW